MHTAQAVNKNGRSFTERSEDAITAEVEFQTKQKWRVEGSREDLWDAQPLQHAQALG